MITNISLMTLYVTDQDESKAFYVDKLGFVEGTDVKMGDGFRWATIKHPDQP
jgi:catechol 2,3-dioxygenase-like lactoylglutathione lyase family enzyme